MPVSSPASSRHTHWSQHAGGYTPAEATRVAGSLLPDVLHYDPRRPASYPDNGRALIDDVVDFFLRLLTNGKVTRDNVGPHKDLLDVFPYVGAPHKARDRRQSVSAWARRQIEAKKRHWKMNVALVDSGGNLVAFQRMDGAMLASIRIAEHKARAAADLPARNGAVREDGARLPQAGGCRKSGRTLPEPNRALQAPMQFSTTGR